MAPNPSIQPVPTQAEPHGEFVGTIDEYGTVWDGEPGATDSRVIGDIIARKDGETFALYLER